MVDSTLAKLIQSRSKSVAAIKAELVKLDELASQSRVPAVQVSLESVAAVKRQRLVRLEAELAAFKAEVDRQQVLPMDPVVRKK